MRLLGHGTDSLSIEPYTVRLNSHCLQLLPTPDQMVRGLTLDCSILGSGLSLSQFATQLLTPATAGQVSGIAGHL